MKFILLAVMCLTVQGLPHSQDKKEGAAVMKEELSKTNEIKTAELVPPEYKKDSENPKPSEKDSKVSSEKEGKGPPTEQTKETAKQNTEEPKVDERSTTEVKQGTTEKSTTVENVIKETKHQTPTWLQLFLSQKKPEKPKQKDISNSELKSADSQKTEVKTKRDLNHPCC